MDRAQLATLLVETGDADRAELLHRHAALAGGELARELKAIVYDAWSSEPARAVNAATALRALAETHEDTEVTAYASWCDGIAALIEGRMERAVEHFDAANVDFTALDRSHAAASTQVPKLIALAMLGRYDQAEQTGLHARDIFLAHDDILAAGKIEQNLGGLEFRRENYSQAEAYYRLAHLRYETISSLPLLAQIENNIANVLTQRYQLRAAERLYRQALARAEAVGLITTQAEIECNLGTLALYQGQYDRALHFLEQSRRRYTALSMPHESAVADQEIADAYLELNLASEAAEIYARVAPIFADLGMRAEEAHALAFHGRAAILLGRPHQARFLLDGASSIYKNEGNTAGLAHVAISKAQVLLIGGQLTGAEAMAREAEQASSAVGAVGRQLLARWLRGEAVRLQGRLATAREVLESTLQATQQHGIPQIAQRCLTSLGLLAVTQGDTANAEAAFKRAVSLIEQMRAPLPAEDFAAAFVVDKLTPYAELVRLCLADQSVDRAVETLLYVERSRSRALLDMLGGTLPIQHRPRDEFEAQVFARITQLREELNWFYSRINRSTEGDASRSATAITGLYSEARHRETELSALLRQLQHSGAKILVPSDVAPVESLDVAQLQRDLGQHTALVEYFTLDNELLAFVVTDLSVEVVRSVGDPIAIEAALSRFRFQIESLRYGKRRLDSHLQQLNVRAQQHLRTLYQHLLAPIEPLLGTRRLVIVPHRELFYVPFHALLDGAEYVVERREVCYAPSASILHHCLARPRMAMDRAVLVGVPDERTPRVRDEVQALSQLFPDCITLLDEQASLAALRRQATTADILHLACHGQFRPDNPLFSSLRLADGWLTVRDTYGLDLRCGLVVLSACETGLSAVSPGDEIIGLARGFFSAGAPSLLVSLWTVDDEATADLMTSFYRRLRAGDPPAAALRHAQRELMRQQPHPYFWSPFMLLGRW